MSGTQDALIARNPENAMWINLTLRCFWFCLVLVGALTYATVAADEIENEISGFVMDRTITRFGHEFTRHLSDFRNMNDLGDYNLTVYERPSARWGNLIWVERNGDRIFQIRLSPSTSDIASIAAQAAQRIHEEVQRQKLRYLFSDKYDLAEDEF